MTKLQDSALKQAGGNNAAPLSKYKTDHGSAKATGAGKTEVPRANGADSTGVTGGNFDPSAMGAIPNNAGPTGTQSGAEAAIASQADNA